MSAETIENELRQHEQVKKYIDGKEIKKVIIVKGKIANIVI
jgi:leucyl-tRNA synthetase